MRTITRTITRLLRDCYAALDTAGKIEFRRLGALHRPGGQLPPTHAANLHCIRALSQEQQAAFREARGDLTRMQWRASAIEDEFDRGARRLGLL